MTLIAAYQYEGVIPGFIFGDGLLTIEEFKPTHKVHLPIKGTFYDSPISGKNYISKLTQKVSIINHNLVISWTGYLGAAKTICNDIYENFNHKSSINNTDFQKYMNSLPSSSTENCCIIGLLTDDTGTERIFALGDPRYRYTPTLPDISHCIVGGTGALEFIRMKEGGRRSVAVRDDLRPRNDFTMAVNQSIAEGYGLLTQEMFSNQTLEKGYGGFYELAWNQGNGYKKLTDVLYGNVTYCVRDKKMGFMMHLYKYDTVSTTTVIRTIYAANNVDSRISVNNMGNIIPSIIDAQNHHDMKTVESIRNSDGYNGCESVGLPDLKASTVCLALHILDRDDSGLVEENHLGTVPLIYHCHRDQTPFMIRGRGRGTQFGYKPELQEMIVKRAETFVRDRAGAG